jgi:hypothetical protein
MNIHSLFSATKGECGRDYQQLWVLQYASGQEMTEISQVKK